MSETELAPFVWLRLLHGAAWRAALAAGHPEYAQLSRQPLRTAVERVSTGLAEQRPGRG